jgi:hypothetical protein
MFAMDDPLFVSGRQPFGDLHGDLDRLTGGHRPVREPRTQRLAFEQFHHRVRRVALAPEVVDGEDVRMRERRHRLGLPLEPRERGRVSSECLGQDLDRDVAIQLRVAGPIHLAHAACPERREDFVGAQAGAGHEHHFKPSTR